MEKDYPFLYLPLRISDSASVSGSMEYGVVIDAGSSGSRVRVYTWTPRHCSEELPGNVQEIFNFKVIDKSKNKTKQNQKAIMHVYHILHMMTSSNGNIFRVIGPLWREITGHQNYGVFFDLYLNKRLCKQSRRRWFETPSRSSCNEYTTLEQKYAHSSSKMVYHGICVVGLL